MKNSSLSLIIPVYNEEQSIEEIICSSIGCLREAVADFEVIVVDDGSCDRTPTLVEELSKKNEGRLFLVRHPENMGFGQALRTGFSKAKYNTIMFNPADNFIYLHELRKEIDLIKKNDIVLGFRDNRRDYSLFRNFASWMYRQLIRVIFGVRFPDIAWVAVYKKKIWEQIKPRSKGGFILAEILIKAKRKNYKIDGLYVHYEPRLKGRSTGAKLTKIFQAIWEICRNSY